ncbi:VOC family protein [Nocardiopsis flavescens]|uniref:VOC family protein n=1 Tax=Nocardiopsis flavescens TaxID=758803 RepID=UPI00365A60DD
MTSPRHNRIDYIEISAPDLEASKRFYGDVFGWEFNDYGPGYAGIRGTGDHEVGGLNPQGPEHRGGGALVLLFSDDLDAAAVAVESAGGRVSQGPYAFPGGRRFHFTDPAGNELGVWSES